MKKRITVFTPTYNRAYRLEKLYNSLVNQTNQSFLWLIVDDGSRDETQELVMDWKKKNLIEINYYKQENGGKQRAHNKGVELCDTELFFCVDSDDYLIERAIESLLNVWDKISFNTKVSGIIALKGESEFKSLDSSMPLSIQYSTLSALYEKYAFKGDTALLYRTEILKRFPFYVVEGEKFMGEGYVYSQIDQEYDMYLMDEVVYVCEYLDDGYSKNIRDVIKLNPRGYMILNKQSAIFASSLSGKFKNTIKYLIGCRLSDEKNAVKNAPYKLLAMLAYPFAMMLEKIFYK